MILYGGPLDGNSLDKDAPFIVWMYGLEGRPMVHRYDGEGRYMGEFEICGHPFPLWNDEYLGYDTHLCALWEGHEDQHMCMEGHFEEGDAVG